MLWQIVSSCLSKASFLIIKIISYPIFIFSFLKHLAKIRFILLRYTALLSFFFEAMKPNLLICKLFFETRRVKNEFFKSSGLSRRIDKLSRYFFLSMPKLYTEILFLLFFLLRAITFLPDFVDILLRKPCFLLLFIFFIFSLCFSITLQYTKNLPNFKEDTVLSTYSY